MSDLLNIKMESSDINEDWVRQHFNLTKERQTHNKSVGLTMDIDEQPFGYTQVAYDKFFDILKNIIDARILHLIVDNNITCAEKFIKVGLEFSTSSWYGEVEPSIYITVDWRHRETNADVIKRLIGNNKRALTTLKRKTKKRNDLAAKIKKLPKQEREELRDLL